MSAILGDIHEVHRAKILNAMEQVYDAIIQPGKECKRPGDAWTTKRVKELREWGMLSELAKVQASNYLDTVLYQAAGNKGCDTERALKSYYKPEHGASTPITTHKLIA